jgi:UDP-galactopyranose mutase
MSQAVLSRPIVAGQLPGEPSECQFDLMCFSHLRWDFVFQRPQHLIQRFARGHRVFFFEEPIFGPGPDRLAISREAATLWRAVPHLSPDRSERSTTDAMRQILRQLMDEHFAPEAIRPILAWYYTPMALSFTQELRPVATVYDCMDELSAFKGAPPSLIQWERELLRRADVVFTGGISLYRAKRALHHNVHAFPSSIDYAHFARARTPGDEPPDQAPIPRPRLGFHGVIDERMDLDLVAEVAERRPDWHLVFIGPVVKIDPRTLPRRPNLHYLGMKPYAELPSYLAGWDVAMMPFALNESTRFISPTKTPEYLAGGKPVVSTPITDVVHPYGELGLVHIAHGPEEFVLRTEEALASAAESDRWLKKVDLFLADCSWNATWLEMNRLVEEAVRKNLRQSRGPDSLHR